MALNDLGCALLEYGKAIGIGAVQGVQASIHSIVHLDETIKSVAKAVYYVGETIALNNYSEEYGFEDLYIPLRDQRNAEIVAGLKHLGNAFLEMSGPERVQTLTKFATDFAISGKIMKVIGGVVDIAKSESIADAAKVAHGVEAAAQEGKLCKAVRQELLNAEKNLEKAGRIVLPAGETFGQHIAEKMLAANVALSEHKFFKLLSQHAGKFELSNVALCEEVEKAFKDFVVHLNGNKDLAFIKANDFKHLPSTHGFGKNKIDLNIKHITEIEYKLAANKVTGLVEIELSGGHAAGLWEVMEKAGVVTIIDKTMLAGGAYELKMINNTTGTVFPKTIFPECWDYKKITEACWHVFDHPNIQDRAGDGSKLLRQGTYENVTFDLVVKFHDKGANIITTNINLK